MTVNGVNGHASGIGKVIIVGAGPAGLLLGLMLAQRNIAVQLLELQDGPSTLPRATHYGPAGIHELRRAGLLDEVRTRGFTPSNQSWRKRDFSIIAALRRQDMAEYENRTTCLPLDKLGEVILRAFDKQSNAQVSWSSHVVDMGETDDHAWVEVEMADATKQRYEGDYVVGCDGANSTVRKMRFGEFPGFTWDKQIVATNTLIDLDKFEGWADTSFVIDKTDWYMSSKISKGKGREAMWRITYGEETGLTNEEYLKRQPMKFERMLPGHPKPDEYEITNISPYKVHQRLVDSMRNGRFLLAADAAHLCNPFGGLGLTGGIADVGSLVDSLAGIHEGKCGPAILDKYSEVRRSIYQNATNPTSTANFERIFQDPDTALEKDDFFQKCVQASTDKEFSVKFQTRAEVLTHDMTQYYDKV